MPLPSPLKTIVVDWVIPLGGRGKVVEVWFTCEGRSGKAKAWAEDVTEGETLDVEFERRVVAAEGERRPETWIRLPKPTDDRLDLERRRLQFECDKQDRFDQKWSKDREAEAHRQASIQAQVVVKAAVDLAVAAGDPAPSAVHGFALDLAETLKQTHDQLFAALAACPDRRGRR